MKSIFNKENKNKAINLLAHGVSSIFSTSHFIGVEVALLSESAEKSIVSRLTGELPIDIINNRRRTTNETADSCRQFRLDVIKKAKELSKVTHDSTMTLVHDYTTFNTSKL